VEKARELGITITASNLCGGGAKSPVWKTILANVLGMRLDTVKTEEGPGYGGAILAMIGCGRFADAREACDTLVSVTNSVYPDPALQALYEKKYRNFRRLYPALKDTFKAIKDN
jgi:xylulokinase